MPIKSILFTIVAIASMGAAHDAFACGGSVGWANPGKDASAISMEAAIAHAASHDGVMVVKSDLQYRCGGDVEFDVKDGSTGLLLGHIPVPRASETAGDGRHLAARVAQLLRTPREQLIALQAASRTFRDDTWGLEEDLGIGAYAPNALPMEARTRNGGQEYLVFVTIAQQCTARSMISPATVIENFPIKTVEYVPGRVDYSPNTIYAAGDLRRAILSDENVRRALLDVVRGNEGNCRETRRDLNWSSIAARLNSPLAELLKTAPERFADSIQAPVAAAMLNEVSIQVRDARLGAMTFSGPVREMVEIQQRLLARGIRVDKRNQLDWKGRMMLDISVRDGRPLPASLIE